jgi:hypothetical protein
LRLLGPNCRWLSSQRVFCQNGAALPAGKNQFKTSHLAARFSDAPECGETSAGLATLAGMVPCLPQQRDIIVVSE